ncbi:right-handed parallel beta-helix repeat-containing protein [Paenibacillus sp. KN14-4R]|uniref:right-handed parallel beta-helix repeat-containing protein n=1 Tax=Paenibacillus sp. KN14-4R TaxID=3445773 RepID=UPI003F9F0BC4
MRTIPKSRIGLIPTTCLIVMILILGLSLLKPHTVNAQPTRSSSELQELVDRTSEGDTLILQEGSYQGPLIVNKAISIQGKGSVEITGHEDNVPVIQIASDNVSLRNITIIQPSEEESPAVLVTGNQAVLDSLTIHTRSFGIVLRDSGKHEISNTSIRSGQSNAVQQQEMLSEKRNGIDLYNSHENRIHNNQISQMNDGIYLENSNRNHIENNKIDHSRYGIHCMYTNETVVRGNYGEFNVTGAMIMGVQDAEVTGNTFSKQSENVNSQGLLLFDVQTSRIINNKVEGNRVGLYIEQSHKNKFEQNEVNQNFVGIQFLESNQNQFMNNRFVGNVIPAEANESTNNQFEQNYWDNFHGIDLNGDGISDMAYAMNPFFQRLTSATPAFQLFFQSPGMQFLESMYTAGKAEWTTDTAPLLNPEHLETIVGTKSKDDTSVWLLGLMLLVFSIIIMTFMGVKRK